MSLVNARSIVKSIPFQRAPKTQGDEIVITCWTGKVLFKGLHNDPMVDTVLDANRCLLCDDMTDHQKQQECPRCDGTGYSGDFEVNWTNENDTRNVYEYINY